MVSYHNNAYNSGLIEDDENEYLYEEQQHQNKE